MAITLEEAHKIMFDRSCDEFDIPPEMAKELWENEVYDIYYVFDNIRHWALFYVYWPWRDSSLNLPENDEEFKKTTEEDWYLWLLEYESFYLGTDGKIYENGWQTDWNEVIKAG